MKSLRQNINDCNDIETLKSLCYELMEGMEEDFSDTVNEQYFGEMKPKVVYDADLKPHDCETMVRLMDDDLREKLHARMDTKGLTDQIFFSMYCMQHESKFGETFPPANY